MLTIGFSFASVLSRRVLFIFEDISSAFFIRKNLPLLFLDESSLSKEITDSFTDKSTSINSSSVPFLIFLQKVHFPQHPSSEKFSHNMEDTSILPTEVFPVPFSPVITYPFAKPVSENSFFSSSTTSGCP